VDFTGGTLANVANGYVHGEANSLMSFASQSMLDAIGHFSSDGLVHIAGQPLTIPASQSLGGSGTLQGDMTNNGTLAPGNSPGAIAVNGNYVQSERATMVMELAGTGLEDFDRLSVSGSAALDGTLTISLLNGFIPSPTDQFQIISASSLNGRFDTINVIGGSFDVIYSSDAVTLSNFAAVPEPAVLLAAAALPLLLRRRARRGLAGSSSSRTSAMVATTARCAR
jgi:hypothetical protein